MRYFRIRLTVLPLVALLALGTDSGMRPGATDSTASGRAKRTAEAINPGVVVVRLARPLSVGKQARAFGLASLDALLRGYDVQKVEAVLSEAGAGKRALDRSALEGVYRVRYASGESPLQVADRLQSDPSVVYAEPLYVHRVTDAPDDQSYGSMHQFARVDAEAAWGVIKSASGPVPVVIAIVDGGTDWEHQDLMDNVWTNPFEEAGDGIDDDENGHVDDIHGWNFALNNNDPKGLPQFPNNGNHGTHVAGIAAAVTDNGIGISSISWNAHFMPINAGSLLTDNDISFGYEGITYAAENGADIISCSWGRSGGSSRFEQDVIDFAYDNGALVVAAAGNDASNTDAVPYFPASYDRVLSVGATGSEDDQAASFTNYGAGVDVFAPGVTIYSTIAGDNKYTWYSGTSMATPMTTGLAALVKTLKPGFSVDELREQVRVTSDDITTLNPSKAGLLGHGRINAHRAVTEFAYPSVRISEAALSGADADGIISRGETVDVSVTFHNSLEGAPALLAKLSTPDAFATPIITEASLPALAKGASAQASFRFAVSNDVPIHHSIRFYVDLEGTDYSDRDLFRLVANPSRAADLDTGPVQTSITTEGNIGALGFFGETAGVGFVHDGTNYLFEGGLMIGTGQSTVSDCLRSTTDVQDQDFKPVYGTDLTVVSPGTEASQVGRVVLVDSLAPHPIGITVYQDTYADSRPENDEFVIFRYKITNTGTEPIVGLYAGLFFDWDITRDPLAIDNSDYDAARKMGYVYNKSKLGEQPTNYAATRLLTHTSGVSYRAVDNADELFGPDGFSDLDKWSFLSGGIQRTSLMGRDISQVTGEGPFDLAVGQSIQVAFAVIGASSLQELEASSD